MMNERNKKVEEKSKNLKSEQNKEGPNKFKCDLNAPSFFPKAKKPLKLENCYQYKFN